MVFHFRNVDTNSNVIRCRGIYILALKMLSNREKYLWAIRKIHFWTRESKIELLKKLFVLKNILGTKLTLNVYKLKHSIVPIGTVFSQAVNKINIKILFLK